MNVEVEAPPKRSFKILRLFIAAAILFLIFISYRVFAVYTIRTGECTQFDASQVPPQWEGVRQKAGRTFHFPRRAVGAQRPLVILTFNIEGHAALWSSSHLRRVADVIREIQPDVVGLQEVHIGTWQSRFADQAAQLAQMTGLNIQYGKSFEALGGEFGNAVLTRGTIVNAGVLPLPSTGEPRTLLRTTIEIDGNRMNVFVTHLAAWGRLQRRSRAEQMSCIQEHLQRSDLPFVLMGDFNAGPDTPEITGFTAGPLVRLLGSGTGETHKVMRNHIDLIFSDHGFEPNEVTIVHSGPSDHWPVKATLFWTEADKPLNQ
ncbi:MAG TPA: endonuclease/exonuclease/phosphatase family protein [Thermoanaerobaculia bacterium]|nr:endonuclease/exonuclease/phosphatase family protein [Thermoanaerobaculia bacterium]